MIFHIESDAEAVVKIKGKKRDPYKRPNPSPSGESFFSLWSVGSEPVNAQYLFTVMCRAFSALTSDS